MDSSTVKIFIFITSVLISVLGVMEYKKWNKDKKRPTALGASIIVSGIVLLLLVRWESVISEAASEKEKRIAITQEKEQFDTTILALKKAQESREDLYAKAKEADTASLKEAKVENKLLQQEILRMNETIEYLTKKFQWEFDVVKDLEKGFQSVSVNISRYASDSTTPIDGQSIPKLTDFDVLINLNNRLSFYVSKGNLFMDTNSDIFGKCTPGRPTTTHMIGIKKEPKIFEYYPPYVGAKGLDYQLVNWTRNTEVDHDRPIYLYEGIFIEREDGGYNTEYLSHNTKLGPFWRHNKNEDLIIEEINMTSSIEHFSAITDHDSISNGFKNAALFEVLLFINTSNFDSHELYYSLPDRVRVKLNSVIYGDVKRGDFSIPEQSSSHWSLPCMDVIRATGKLIHYEEESDLPHLDGSFG